MDGQKSAGLRIGRLRREKNLTMAELARQASVSVPTVWAWEKGKVSPHRDRTPALALILGVTQSELLTGEVGTDEEDRARVLLQEVHRSRARIAALAHTTVDKVEISIRS